jgi:hypothetical protein
MEAAQSLHWTDDELINYIYGVGPQNGHLNVCDECRSRLANMDARRAMSVTAGADVSHNFLAAQRRSIYARLAEPDLWWRKFHVRRWASVLATGSLLAAGLLYYADTQQQTQISEQVSDAQLVQDVSNMAQDPEPSPTAPLEALFEQ